MITVEINIYDGYKNFGFNRCVDILESPYKIKTIRRAMNEMITFYKKEVKKNDKR